MSTPKQPQPIALAFCPDCGKTDFHVMYCRGQVVPVRYVPEESWTPVTEGGALPKPHLFVLVDAVGSCAIAGWVDEDGLWFGDRGEPITVRQWRLRPMPPEVTR